MFRSSIFIPKNEYKEMCQYLFPRNVKQENVAFIFANVSESQNFIKFQFKKWYAVQSKEYEYHSLYYVELKDEMRPKIIKMAFDLDAAIIEIHSHPFQKSAYFSPSDIDGLNEFIPHVRWRLKNRPYSAIVFSKYDFDGLVWHENVQIPKQLTEIVIEKEHLYSNGVTLNCKIKKWT